MSAFDLNWTHKRLIAVGTLLRRFMLSYGLQKFLPIFLLGDIWVVNPSPPLLLSLLEVLLQLPPSLHVAPIMQIQTAVSEGAISRIMPILAQIEDIVKAATVLDGRIEPRRTHLFLIGFFGFIDVVCCHLVTCVAIHPSIYFSVQLALFCQFSRLHVLQKTTLRQFFLEFFRSQIQILNQILTSFEITILECFMDGLVESFLAACCTAGKQSLHSQCSRVLFILFLGLILQLFFSIMGVLIFIIFGSLERIGLPLFVSVLLDPNWMG